jgi:pimeloyl-ACP methyl ester carboxylesterase
MHPTHPSDPTPRTLERAAGALSYTDEGEGEVLLAVPGLPGSARDFRWLAPALTDHMRVVRVTLPGFGASARSGHRGMTIAERAAPVLELISALKLPPVTLLGHSSGATVVAHLGRHHPAQVRRCVLVASPGPEPHYPRAVYRRLAPLFARRAGRLALTPLQRGLYRAFGFPRSLTDRERMFTTLDAAACDFDAHADNVRALTQPTLLCWAQDDRLIPARLSEALAALAPEGPRLCFEQGGHNLQKTQALEIAEAIRAL